VKKGGKRNIRKTKQLNTCILRFILRDNSSSYDQLLDKVNLTLLHIKTLQNMLLLLYKKLFVSDYLLLDEVFVISRIIKAKAGVINWSRSRLYSTYQVHKMHHYRSEVYNQQCKINYLYSSYSKQASIMSNQVWLCDTSCFQCKRNMKTGSHNNITIVKRDKDVRVTCTSYVGWVEDRYMKKEKW